MASAFESLMTGGDRAATASLPIGMMVMATTPTATAAAESDRKRKRVPHPRKGTKFRSYERYDWYRACVAFTEKKKDDPQMSMGAFLKSDETPIEHCISTVNTFRRRLRDFQSGAFTQPEKGTKRVRKGTYYEVEMKLVQYVKLQAKLHHHQLDSDGNFEYETAKYGNNKLVAGGCGVSWKLLKSKCTVWKEQQIPMNSNYQNFTISAGWIGKVLERHGLSNISQTLEEEENDESGDAVGGVDGHTNNMDNDDNNNSDGLEIQSYFDAEKYFNQLRMYAKKHNISASALDSFEDQLIKHELARM